LGRLVVSETVRGRPQNKSANARQNLVVLGLSERLRVTSGIENERATCPSNSIAVRVHLKEVFRHGCEIFSCSNIVRDVVLEELSVSSHSVLCIEVQPCGCVEAGGTSRRDF